jgi:hypothetical protein
VWKEAGLKPASDRALPDCHRDRSTKCGAITFRRFIRPTLKRTAINLVLTARNPGGIQTPRDLRAELGASRMEKIEELLGPKLGSRIIAWITNSYLFFSEDGCWLDMML